MLTPQEISGKEFVKAVFGGYDMSAVDDFLETLTADYTALYKENAILKSKIKVLVEKVEEYRTTDDAMRMALLTAQRLGDEITAEAKKKSEEMMSQTESEIRQRLQDIKSRFTEEEERLKSVKEATRKYVLASQEILHQQSIFLSKVEELNRDTAVPVSAPEPPAAPAQPAAAEPTEAPAPVAAPAVIPQPAPEKDEVTATAKQIDEAIFNAPDDGSDDLDAMFKDEETAKLFHPKRESHKPENNLDATSPKPKFDFNNLKFGSNYSGN